MTDAPSGAAHPAVQQFTDALKKLWPQVDTKIPGLVEGIIASAPAVFAKYGLTSALVVAHGSVAGYGRDGYMVLAKKTGLDLINHPQLITAPAGGFATAGGEDRTDRRSQDADRAACR